MDFYVLYNVGIDKCGTVYCNPLVKFTDINKYNKFVSVLKSYLISVIDFQDEIDNNSSHYILADVANFDEYLDVVCDPDCDIIPEMYNWEIGK